MNDKYWEERRFYQAPRSSDTRNPYERDESRLIHSAAFRRLQSKTQVLGLGESDFYRTRLTHSMEVAQIGRGIVGHLEKNTGSEYENELPDIALITSICLAHDIGHPPFGHGGEIALNYCMRRHGGFEGNGQTLRILAKLDKYTEKHGLNPTRRMLLGVLKYPKSYSELVNESFYEKVDDTSLPYWLFKAKSQKPPKCFHDNEQDIVDFIFSNIPNDEKDKFMSFKPDGIKHKKTLFKSFDCSIMNLADNISYSLHDLEDAISLGLITQKAWEEHFNTCFVNKPNLFDECASENISLKYLEVTKNLFGESYQRKETIGALVNLMITSTEVSDNGSGCTISQLKYKAELKPQVEELRKAIFQLVEKEVILHENVQQLEFKGQKLVIELFQALNTDPERFLPKNTLSLWKKEGEDAPNEDLKESAQIRVICDFVAGMTDDYATRFYEKLFCVGKGSIFDRQ